MKDIKLEQLKNDIIERTLELFKLHGQVGQTNFFVHKDYSMEMMFGGPMDNIESKDEYVKMLKVRCIDMDIIALIRISEAWMVTGHRDNPEENAEANKMCNGQMRVRDSKYRQDILMITLSTPDYEETAVYNVNPTIRTVEFHPMEQIEDMKGRFSNYFESRKMSYN